MQSELRISGNIRNSFWLEYRNAKQKITEREIQSRRGSSPPGAMVAMDQRGNSPPPREEAKEEEGGGLSSPFSQWRRSVAGASIVTAIYTSNFSVVTTNSLPLYAEV